MQDEHQVYEASARKNLEDAAAQALESNSAADPDGAASTPSTVATVIDRPSPLSVPLTASLEDLRRERRRSMSHSTRIRVEALTGDRELDLDQIRMVISRGYARREGSCVSESPMTFGGPPPSVSSPSSTQLLRKLEAECSALCVLDWAAAAEFSFSRELRKPDQRWTAACVKLEGRIADWLSRRKVALAAARGSRRRGGRVARDGRGCQEAATTPIPPVEEDQVWQALESFQLEAGDVVDDRHSSAEAITREIGDEAEQRMRAWARNLESAAAGLCAAERATHLEAVGTLDALNRLFGLEEDESTGSVDLLRGDACAAADALWKELSVALKEQLCVSAGGGFENEVRCAVEEVYEDCGTTPSDHDPSQRLERLQALGPENQAEASLPRENKNVDDGLVGSYGSGEANSHTTGSAISSTTRTAVDLGSGKSDGEEDNGAWAMAVWRCRQTYVCRLRGIVVRISRAAERCEAKVSSMRAALRRLKRHRVQVEHEGISTGTATVRRALEECDYTTIAEILENGIPVGRRNSCDIYDGSIQSCCLNQLSGIALRAGRQNNVGACLHGTSNHSRIEGLSLPLLDCQRSLLLRQSADRFYQRIRAAAQSLKPGAQNVPKRGRTFLVSMKLNHLPSRNVSHQIPLVITTLRRYVHFLNAKTPGMGGGRRNIRC